MIAQIFLISAVSSIALASLPVVHQPIVHHAPQPYKFGYDVKDKHGEQYRQETGDGHSGVQGSYGFTDARGVKRQVDYVADKAGFRAQVKTNEPGTANQNPAAVLMVSDAPYAGGIALGGLGYGGPVGGFAVRGIRYGSLSGEAGNGLANGGLGNLAYDALGNYGGPINTGYGY